MKGTNNFVHVCITFLHCTFNPMHSCKHKHTSIVLARQYLSNKQYYEHYSCRTLSAQQRSGFFSISRLVPPLSPIHTHTHTHTYTHHTNIYSYTKGLLETSKLNS